MYVVFCHTSRKSISNIYIFTDREGSYISGELGSNFSPRMDFEQWKPLTGRGDPLRNDPTYDYEPPVLERVHYWADDARVERERIPEKKSEVLVLGVSSRKPSVAPRQPPPSIKRTHRPPSPPKYEDYTYRYSEYYPMTILVPPPLPPPGHQPSLYITPEQKLPISLPKQVDRPIVMKKPTTVAPEHLASFAVQEANLIYQSSTTSQNWFLDLNNTKTLPNNPVTSDYAGWGPTTPFNDNDIVNDTYNFILNDHIIDISNPYKSYKPVLSESPISLVTSSQLITAFVPTALPPLETTLRSTQETWTATERTVEPSTENLNSYEETTTTQPTTNKIVITVPTPSKSKLSLFDMLAPMMSMPLATDPDRPEDNLYAHASENIQVFKEHTPQEIDKLEEMQSMKPPPLVNLPESTTVSERQPFHVKPHILNHLLHAKPSVHTHDPYLHMRFTTPTPPFTTETVSSHDTKSSTEIPTVPMYLIIQGHSKVKTYSSKAKNNQNVVSQNDVSKQTVTNEVKHLHPLKEKKAKQLKFNETREGRAQNLKSLIDNGLGSIEIQETDLGIKYDVSDGSDVPLELYKKGIVDSGENNYYSHNESNKQKRNRREIKLLDLLTSEEDSFEDYVDDLIKGQKNDTGITQLLTQVGSGTSTINELENEDLFSELENEYR